MKRAVLLALVMSVMAVSLAPATAQAGWITMSARRDRLKSSMAESDLVNDWKEGLYAANELYGNMFWALDYIDAWTENTTWDNLACARTACILVSGHLNEFEYPQLSLSESQMEELVEAGVETNVMAEFYGPDEDRLMMYPYFRGNLLPRLDTDAIWAYELETVKDLSAAMRAYLQIECDILRYATNYLLLPLFDQAEGEAMMEELKAAYPVIFPQDVSWITDVTQLENINVELSDQTLPDAMNEWDAAILRSISRSENAIMDMEDGKVPEKLSIQGQPESLPVPLWYDTEHAGFLSFHYNEDETLIYPECGDVLTKDDCNIYLQQADVSLEQVEAYMEEVASYAKEVTRRDNAWTISMDGYDVLVSWENQTVTMSFFGESSTLMDEYRVR